MFFKKFKLNTKKCDRTQAVKSSMKHNITERYFSLKYWCIDNVAQNSALT